jgi:hypothetical protein
LAGEELVGMSSGDKSPLVSIEVVIDITVESEKKTFAAKAPSTHNRNRMFWFQFVSSPANFSSRCAQINPETQEKLKLFASHGVKFYSKE